VNSNSGKPVSVDEKGFVLVDGVKIGRRVVRQGAIKIEFCDKDRRRSQERGTRLVEVSVEELGEAVQSGQAGYPAVAGGCEAEGGNGQG
jgi:hypothetical protein